MIGMKRTMPITTLFLATLGLQTDEGSVHETN